MSELHALSASAMVAAYRDGSLSPVEVTQAVLQRIERCEPVLCATYALDADAALSMARAAEARWRAGTPISVGGVCIDGVPTTIKENIATRGVPVPVGTAASLPVPAAADAPPAARLREAGAVFVAKTTMPEYGMLSSGLSSFHALARNPWNTAMNPGGSSAGAGAAGAAGYGPLHIGTDIGGSVRLPAAWCGLAGLKPSLGRVPIDPPYMGRCAGPMTRTVTDAALMMAVLSRPDPRDHMSLPPADIPWLSLQRELKGLRIGLLLEAGCGMPVSPQVQQAVVAAARLFEQAGAVIETLQPWMSNELLHGVDRFWRIRSGVDVQALPPERRAKVLPIVRQWAEGGLGFSGEQAFEAYSMTFKTRATTVAATQPYDYVLSPVSPNTSFPAEWAYPTNNVNEAMDHIGFTLPFSMSEQPAASVNCGYDSNGVPIGLQIAGRRFDDLGVLQMAAPSNRCARPNGPGRTSRGPDAALAVLSARLAGLARPAHLAACAGRGAGRHRAGHRHCRHGPGGGRGHGPERPAHGRAAAHVAAGLCQLVPAGLPAPDGQPGPAVAGGGHGGGAEPALRGVQRRVEPLLPPPEPAPACGLVVLCRRPDLRAVHPAPPPAGRQPATTATRGGLLPGPGAEQLGRVAAVVCGGPGAGRPVARRQQPALCGHPGLADPDLAHGQRPPHPRGRLRGLCRGAAGPGAAARPAGAGHHAGRHGRRPAGRTPPTEAACWMTPSTAAGWPWPCWC